MTASGPGVTGTAVTGTILTPTIRHASRRSLFWTAAIAVVLAIVIVALILKGVAGPEGQPLSATNAAPAGSMAVAQVLGQHGVTVTEAHTVAATTTAATDPDNTTILLFDPDDNLDAARLKRVAALSRHLILVTPTFAQLRAVAPEVAQAGAAKKSARTADCDLPAVTKAGAVSGGGSGYRLVDKRADAATCLSSGKGIFSLIEVRHDGTRVTVLGAADAISNESVADHGNAALALNLLGEKQNLIWYLPSVEDQAGGIPSIADLTPPWVSTLALLCFCVAIAAAFWRGRRLGPLVIENLPVTVRASETMEGRARLYQKSSARLHALDALRIGSIERLASLCGLPRTATVDEVIAAVARLTSGDSARIAHILVGAVPHTDRELLRLSDDLLTLETTLASAITR